ncbi:MAG: site-specific integrase [Rikenellaceae bacterium]|nr:site-specific integrase [Rikenellaceae bacterium]
MRLYVSRTIRPHFGTGIWIDAKRWGKKNDINIPTTPGEERDSLIDKKSKLKSLTDTLEALVISASDKSNLTKEYFEKEVKKFHKPKKEKEIKEITFFTVADDYLNKHLSSESRIKHFKVLIRCLRRFELYKRKTDNKRYKLNFGTLSHEDLKEIEWSFFNEKEVYSVHPDIYDEVPYYTKQSVKTPQKNDDKKKSCVPEERGQNYVSDMLIRFLSFIIWANDNNFANNNPFKNYPIQEPVYGTPIYISVEERKKLYEADFSENPMLATQRDIFVFQTFIGCRVGDLIKFTYNNVINGNLEYIPKKTKDDRADTLVVPLSPTAIEIIERYRDERRNSLLPFISEQKYNEYIKEAFKLAGLDRMVTVINQRTRLEEQKPLYELAFSHMARRTFIGNIYKKVKYSNLVGSLSGHKEGSRAFARYRNIDDDIKKELIAYLE